jgi:uncharacterized protein (TIGR00251 family)
MIITVDVKTGQHEEYIQQLEKNHYMIKVKTHAIKGKANKAVIKLLKNHFGQQVFLVTGHSSSRKIFEIEE